MAYERISVVKFSALLILVFALVQTPVLAVAGAARMPAAKPSVLTPQQRVRHVLSRLTFGARPGDVERVTKIGVEAFIREQLDPGSIDDSALNKRLEKLPTLSLSTPVLAEQYNPPKPTPTPTPPPGTATPPPTLEGSPTPTPKPTPPPKNPGMVVTELQRAKLLRAVYSERQLNEVLVDFWLNHFSIYINKDADRWMMTSFDRDSVRPHAMGNFRDLLGSVARSPAMLYYLDNWQSSLVRDYPATKDKPARRSGGINENYARELMELHTLGVEGGYSQTDVQEVARCFTGWTVRKPNQEGIFFYNPAMHDNGEKTVLGVRIASGGGIADGEKVLDILSKHPATARFISTKLARRFLGDDPPPAAVARAAKVFLATDGSITETVRSLITSKEFSSPAVYQAKVKTPFEYVAATLRATAAETDANRPVLDWISRMGQPVFGRVTPDGYPDKASEWLSSNDLLARLNFAGALMLNNIKGTTVKVGEFIVLPAEPLKMPDAVIKALLAGTASDKTRAELAKLAADPPAAETKVVSAAAPAGTNAWAATAARPDDRKKAVAAQLVALALGSPEFQRR